MHPLYAVIPDPSGMEPLYGREEFAEEVAEMVADEAPRLFAVVQEYGDRVDARISAWGMSFRDHADLIGVGGNVRLGMRSAEHALRWARVGTRVTPSLVWVDASPDRLSR
jgi:hypothetical protein